MRIASILATVLATLGLLSGNAVLAQSQTPASHEQGHGRTDEAESEDDDAPEPDDFEWLIVSLDTGYRALDVQKVEFEDEGSTAKLIPVSSGGPSPGLALGVRMWFVSLMLRGDVTFLTSGGEMLDDEFELWNLDLEAAFRFAQGRVQPYLLAGIGYSVLGGFSDVVEDVRRATDASGANARLGVGLDYYLTEELTLGFRGTIDGLLLGARTSARDLATPETVDTLGETEARLREADGSLIGLSYGAGITFGVHAL